MSRLCVNRQCTCRVVGVVEWRGRALCRRCTRDEQGGVPGQRPPPKPSTQRQAAPRPPTLQCHRTPRPQPAPGSPHPPRSPAQTSLQTRRCRRGASQRCRAGAAGRSRPGSASGPARTAWPARRPGCGGQGRRCRWGQAAGRRVRPGSMHAVQSLRARPALPCRSRRPARAPVAADVDGRPRVPRAQARHRRRHVGGQRGAVVRGEEAAVDERALRGARVVERQVGAPGAHVLHPAAVAGEGGLAEWPHWLIHSVD